MHACNAEDLWKTRPKASNSACVARLLRKRVLLKQCRRVGREVTLHPQDMKQPPRTKRKGAKAKAGRLKHNLRVPSRAELQRRMSSSGAD